MGGRDGGGVVMASTDDVVREDDVCVRRGCDVGVLPSCRATANNKTTRLETSGGRRKRASGTSSTTNKATECFAVPQASGPRAPRSSSRSCLPFCSPLPSSQRTAPFCTLSLLLAPHVVAASTKHKKIRTSSRLFCLLLVSADAGLVKLLMDVDEGAKDEVGG